MELEREHNDLLIIAHESVLRVLYGYLMACNAVDIPSLSFPRDEIIEIVPASYQNNALRLRIDGLPPEIVPGSPEDIQIPVPPSQTPSGSITPMKIDTPPKSGLNSPRPTPLRSVSPQNILLEPRDSQHPSIERAKRC